MFQTASNLTLMQAAVTRNKANVLRSSRDAVKGNLPPAWYRSGTGPFFEKHARAIVCGGIAGGMAVPKDVRSALKVCPFCACLAFQSG